jgi:hypothetical protein
VDEEELDDLVAPIDECVEERHSVMRLSNKIYK